MYVSSHAYMYTWAYKCIRHPIIHTWMCRSWSREIVRKLFQSSQWTWVSITEEFWTDCRPSDLTSHCGEVSVSKLRVSGSTGDGKFQVFLSGCWWYLSFLLLVEPKPIVDVHHFDQSMYTIKWANKRSATPPHAHIHILTFTCIWR